MPILEKIVKPEEAKHWPDSIPLEYHYTAGVAGEEFLRELKENGNLIASKCPKCKNSYVPVRMYCPDCFVETSQRHKITTPGQVYSYTVMNRDRTGKRMEKPVVVALVKFDGIKGGLVHVLDIIDPKEASIGMKVVPVLKDKEDRVGALSDILAFRPD